jgi:ribosomal protein L40E
MKKKKAGKRVTPPSITKICNRCGAENLEAADTCEKCGSTKFAPDWVVSIRRINRQFAVQITKSNPQYGDVSQRITLSKWWPGNSTTLHIPNPEQWQRIEAIINDEFVPILGWKPKADLLADVKSGKRQQQDTSSELRTLLQQYPEFLGQVAASASEAKLHEADIEQLVEVVNGLTKMMATATAGFKDAFFRLLENLPQQGQRALEDLEMLLHKWSLHQITGVTQQVRARLETIEVFEKQIHDERTFEIRGPSSIHRILERAMWLIDERYWLLQSNGSLLKFIGDEMEKEDKKKYGKRRPDFACGTIGDRLIIIELKRPAHSLEIADVNQLETYLTVAEKYKSYRSYEAWLVGNKKTPELISRMKHRSNNFKVVTYSDLLDDTRQRYRDFLNVTDSTEGANEAVV